MPYKYKYKLPDQFLRITKDFDEFKDGAMIATVELINKQKYKILILMYTDIIGVKNHDHLPFDVNDIIQVYQTEEDKNPKDIKEWNMFQKAK
ncbi:MAG: hypothetical protein P9M03_10275 [Candidatus Theseobacter exili]|nr:hypothetical protein [Candidatus Theseobacter exili]